VRSEIIRIYKIVHTWTGILAGMALFIAFYAGAITAFKEPLARWASPPAATSMVPLEDAQSLITRTLTAHPEAARELRVNLRPSEQVTARVEWEIHDEDADEHDRLSARHYVATVDEEGAVRVDEAHPSRLAELIDVLHRVVGLPVDGDLSRSIMGVIATLYALALVSGVIVLLPSLVKDFFALRVGNNLKRMWLDAHNVVGVVSLPFHLVMAVTAAVFAFHDGIYFVQDKMIHDGKRSAAFQARSAPSGGEPRDPAAMLPPTELVARVEALSPTFEPTMLQYVQVTGPRAAVRVWGHDARSLSPRAQGGFAMVDPYSGRVVSTDYLPGRQDAPQTLLSSFFALHFGTYGGHPAKWVYFLLGLLGAWLFYSGNLLWIETRRRKASRRGQGEIPAQRRDTSLMASATVGVCLGSICGISLTIVAAKWLHGHVADLSAWHRYLYYAMFFGAIGWAFVRGGARAAVNLLWLAAALTVAIPLTTLLAWLFPSLGMWAHTSAAPLGVDATALAGALGFACLARATSRRVYEGPTDSVWSVRRPLPAVAGAEAAPDVERATG